MHQDRLSALMSRFALSVTPAPAHIANLFVLTSSFEEDAVRIIMCLNGDAPDAALDDVSLKFSAFVDWGGRHNPLLVALPDQIDQTVSGKLEPLVGLLVAEQENTRCGSASVLARLAEVLVVCLLREQLSQGTTEPGLLGGLADERISRVIVAMHEKPGHAWCNAELADLAGLSASRFSELFLRSVGQSPAAYLRKWRLVLAKQDIERGDRVQVVAWRYCYKSSEALGRAFRRMFGETPTGRSILSKTP